MIIESAGSLVRWLGDKGLYYDIVHDIFYGRSVVGQPCVRDSDNAFTFASRDGDRHYQKKWKVDERELHGKKYDLSQPTRQIRDEIELLNGSPQVLWWSDYCWEVKKNFSRCWIPNSFAIVDPTRDLCAENHISNSKNLALHWYRRFPLLYHNININVSERVSWISLLLNTYTTVSRHGQQFLSGKRCSKSTHLG